jgi:hypothetical protein
MIMATDLLRQRIEQVKCARRAANAKGLPGYEDDTPTLVDVERSHILYVNAHFKPFAAIGYEYQKVGSQQGVANFGSQVTYSIPQFGDFFYDMVLNIGIPAVTPTSVNINTGTITSPDYSSILAGLTRTITHVRYVSASGTPILDPFAIDANPNGVNVPDTPGAAVPWADFVRYCEFPAMRTVAQVQFTVNGNPLDQYDYNTYAYYEQFRVRPGKRIGWNRGVGQQVAYEGFGDLTLGNSQIVEPAGIPASTADNLQYSQVQYNIVNGPQTPQPTQPAQDWWIKLLLWFNEDVRLSVPSVSIPYGQRFIIVNFANMSDVLFTTGAGLIKETSVTTITYSGAGINDYATATNVFITRNPVLVNSTIPPLPGAGFSRADLYINNIFVNPEIHDIYIKRIGFNLIRVHRIQKTFVNTPGQDILLSQLKWPVEYFFAGIRPSENENPNGNSFVWRNWHRFVQAVPRNITLSCPIENTTLLTSTPGTTVATSVLPTVGGLARNVLTYDGGCDNVLYWDEYQTIDTVQISAHQIPIYKFTPSAFFNNHLPLQFGGVNINTPSDKGALLINFCLYPGTYQPSGHFNISRAREFYFNFTSSLINSNYTGQLLVDSSALNFLLISDGSAVLRYST